MARGIGGCERSGQVAGQIVNGALVYSAGCVSVSGRVNSEGKLNGKATMGPYYLIGSGSGKVLLLDRRTLDPLRRLRGDDRDRVQKHESLSKK